MNQQFEAIHGFIRMIASGIVIGESTSNIKLKLENDILYFFTGDEDSVSTENAIAYFSAGKLYVNQKAAGLEVDGKAGPLTIAALGGTYRK